MYGSMLVDVVGHTTSLKKIWMQEDTWSVVKAVPRLCGWDMNSLTMRMAKETKI